MDPNFNDSDPSKVQWFTYYWVWGMSVLGSVAAHVERVRTGKTRGNRFVDFVASICTGALVGMITFYVCEAYHIDRMLSAAIIGVASNMGEKILAAASDYVIKKARAL